MAIVATLAIRAGGTGVPPHERPEPQQTFRSRVDLVTVSVAVTRGRTPVAGLTAADFELRDNGVVQTIDHVARENVPIDVTAVVSGALAQKGAEDRILRGALAASRLHALMLPEDRLRVLSIRPDGVHEATQPDEPAVRDVHVVPRIPLVDGIFYALSFPVEPGRRHLIVVFTDGNDGASIIEPARLRDLTDRSDAVLHAVLYALPPALPVSGVQSLRFGPGGSVTVLSSGVSPGALRTWRESFDALTSAVRRSGGLLHRLSEGIDPFEEVLDDFRNSYLLSYRPTGVELAGWHDIDVKVTRRGPFDIRARRGYQGGRIE